MFLGASNEDGTAGQGVDADHSGDAGTAGIQLFGYEGRIEQSQALTTVFLGAGQIHESGFMSLVHDIRRESGFLIVLKRSGSNLVLSKIPCPLL